MKIRTILAAAAAPAALAAVLLGTAGQASAAVTQGPAAAVLTANVHQTYTGKVTQTGLPDTTSVTGSATLNNDSVQYGPIGPVWALDNITRNIVVSPVAGQPGTWTVQFTENGTYSSVADPNTGKAWKNTGNMHGSLTYTVTSPNQPDMSKLPANLPALTGDPANPVNGHGAIMSLIFGGPVSVLSAPYSYHYTQVEDVPGVYIQVG